MIFGKKKEDKELDKELVKEALETSGDLMSLKVPFLEVRALPLGVAVQAGSMKSAVNIAKKYLGFTDKAIEDIMAILRETSHKIEPILIECKERAENENEEKDEA
jgi:hypothetical protein